MGHVTITVPHLGMVCHRWAGTSNDHQYTKFEISMCTQCEDIKGDKNTEIGMDCGLEITQGRRQHSHSIEHI